jgi:putative protease
MEERVGRVTHYYNRIRVAVLELRGRLNVGDVVHFRGHTTDFVQKIESMEIEHERVESVGPGSDVALRVNERVRRGDDVFKVIEESRSQL